MKTLVLSAAALVAIIPGRLVADEKKEDIVPKQKTAAEDMWKKMEFPKTPALVESKSFLLFSRLPEARSKALGVTLEKHLATAAKGLKFDKEEKLWNGKLAVFILPERRDFVNFLRQSQKRSPRDGETAFTSLTGDEPTMVIGEPEGNVTPENLAAYELATSLLKRKMGAGDPPDWVTDGFARATAYRAANPGTMGKAFKAPTASFAALWSDQASAELRSNYGAYILDYLAYGPGSDWMANFLSALRPGENGAAPTADQVLASVAGEWATFEYYARKWTKPAASKPSTPPKKKKT